MIRRKAYGLVWILVVLLFLIPSALSSTIDPTVIRALEKQEEVSVIVTLVEPPAIPSHLKSSTPEAAIEQLRETVQEQQEKVLDTLDLKEEQTAISIAPRVSTTTEDTDYEFILGHQFSTINGFSGKVTEEALEKLAADPHVKSIAYDRPIHLLLDTSGPLINADEVHNLSINGQWINGTGETVCVIDTGIDYTHSALGSCNSSTVLAGTCAVVIGGVDIADRDNDPLDGNGHGTHIAGIIASQDSTYRGIAPGVKLVAVKVFPGTSGTTNSSNVIAGLDWCRNNATIFNISIITTSLGDSIQHAGTCDDDSLANAVNIVANRGFFVAAASGNNGFSNGINSPACASNVTSVSRSNDDDSISSGGNSGANLDLLAPGTTIKSLALGSGFTENSGTSMSSPHVAAAAALFRQYSRSVYGVTPTIFQIENKMKRTGVLLTDARNGLLFPRLDILAAVQPLINFTANSPANNSSTANPFALINISADVNLSSALLQWDYTNGTIRNITMTLVNQSSFYENVTGLSTANYTYKVFGNDSANLFGVSEERTLRINLIPPVINISTPINASYYRQALTMNITITSSLAISFSNYSLVNASGTEFQNGTNNSINTSPFTWTELINFSNSTFPDGNYTLFVSANDSTNNLARSSVLLIIDKSAPALFTPQRNPEPIFNNDTVIIRINVTDQYLNTTAIYLEANFSGTVTNYSMAWETGDRYNATISGKANLSNNGNISYVIHALDLVGNKNTSETYSFLVKNRAPTTVTITFPANGTVVEVGNNSRFNASAADPDGDAITYNWNFSDGTALASGQNTTHQFNSTGTFVIIVDTTDGVNHTLANITIISNDTQAPTTTLISYNSEHHLQRNGNSQNVNATFFDHSGIFTASLTSNSSTKTATCTEGSTTWSCTWNWNSLAVGSHTFTIETKDNFATRHTNSTSYTFSVTSCSDTSKNGDETGVDCGGSCNLTCSASDSGSSSSSGGSGGAGGGSSAGASPDLSTTEGTTPTVLGVNPPSETEESKSTISAEPPAVVVDTSQPVRFSLGTSLEKGKILTIPINDKQIPVNEIILDADITRNLTIEVVSYSQKPDDLLELTGVYRYLDILPHLTNDDLDKGSITFTVPQSWLLENNYAEETVALNALRGNTWKPLKTKLIFADGNNLLFQAKIEDLSYYAITAKSELELSWFGRLIPPKIGTKEFVLFGLIIFIAVLLIIYLMIRKKEE